MAERPCPDPEPGPTAPEDLHARALAVLARHIDHPAPMVAVLAARGILAVNPSTLRPPDAPHKPRYRSLDGRDEHWPAGPATRETLYTRRWARYTRKYYIHIYSSGLIIGEYYRHIADPAAPAGVRTEHRWTAEMERADVERIYHHCHQPMPEHVQALVERARPDAPPRRPPAGDDEPAAARARAEPWPDGTIAANRVWFDGEMLTLTPHLRKLWTYILTGADRSHAAVARHMLWKSATTIGTYLKRLEDRLYIERTDRARIVKLSMANGVVAWHFLDLQSTDKNNISCS